MADKQSDKERDATLALFLLGSAAIAAFAAAIYDAQVSAATSAYLDAADAIGADASDFTLPDDLLRTMAKNAQESAQSIVNTYNESITREAANYTGDDLHAHLAEWARAREAWKTEQIALYETSKGYSAGIDTFVSDLLDESLDLPDGTMIEDLGIFVEPSEAAEPICMELVAGSPYPLDAADDVLGDTFPVHLGCPHYSVIGFL